MHTTTPLPQSTTSDLPETVLADTGQVAAFMDAFDQTVRTTPTREITDSERLLRVRLVVEEALEFAEAMGVSVFTATNNGRVDAHDLETALDPRPLSGIDLVAATDALADLVVVTKGSALTLGVPLDEVFEVVHAANMAKLGPDGEPIRDEHGKVCKPVGWVGPEDRIREVLTDHGWDANEEVVR